MRQGPQDDTRDDGEDRRIHADAERNGENGGCSETWRAYEHARGEADVLARVLEPGRDHRVDRLLSVRPWVAEPRPGIAARLLGGHASSALFFLDERHMRVQFLSEVIVHARPAHEIPELAKW
jgi:hypothetical protein